MLRNRLEMLGCLVGHTKGQAECDHLGLKGLGEDSLTPHKGLVRHMKEAHLLRRASLA
jgi:hypothetical protein